MNVSPLVLVRGGGELASACAHALFLCRIPVVIAEISRPLVVRRLVAFASVIYEGETVVEGVPAFLSSTEDAGKARRGRNEKKGIRVVIDPAGDLIDLLKPDVLLDARMLKRPPEPVPTDVPLRIGLGPGFTAGVDVDAVIETMRGPDLGRIYYLGKASKNTGVPGMIDGYGEERVIRAPVAGLFMTDHSIGESVRSGQTIGHVGSGVVRADTSGMIRGLLAPGLDVRRGQKLGDIDPRGTEVNPRRISDKGRTVAGSVLQVIFSRFNAAPGSQAKR